MNYAFRVQYQFDPETGNVCAVIPKLNYLSDYGSDFEEAESNILKALQLYLEENPHTESEESVLGTKIFMTA